MPNKGPSWTAIIIALFLFFPVGIGLMLSKLHKDKEHSLANGKIIAALGWIVVGFGAVYLLIALTGGAETTSGESVTNLLIMIFVFFACIGLPLVLHGNKYKKLGKKYTRYLAIIANSPDGSLQAIAAAYPKPYEDVCRELQKMINAGFFPGCYLDINHGRFVSPLTSLAQAASSVDYRAAAPAAFKSKVVKCPNCGGTNTITAVNIECEYCGSPLEA